MMTDKEKMQDLLDRSLDSIRFEYFIRDYLEENYYDFTLRDILKLSEIISNVIISKTNKYESAINTANERLDYLIKYLKGEMYTTKEAAEAAIDIQIKNAEVAKLRCLKALGGKNDKEW